MTARDATWVVEPPSDDLPARLRELVASRSLLLHFAREAVKRRYQRTILGWAWLFIRPLAAVAAAAILFGRVLQVDPGPVPYFLFFLTGFAIWSFFDFGLMWVTRSLEINRRLLKKVYFPRLLLPLSHLGPPLFELGIYLVILVLTLLFYRLTHGTLYLADGAAPLLALLAIPYVAALALGIGLWTSVLGAVNRDLRFTLRYVLQFWFYLTPVIYPLTRLDGTLRVIAELNPMTFPVTLMLSGIGIGAVPSTSIVSGLVVCVVAVVSGLWFFHSNEATSLDRL